MQQHQRQKILLEIPPIAFNATVHLIPLNRSSEPDRRAGQDVFFKLHAIKVDLAPTYDEVYRVQPVISFNECDLEIIN